MDGHASAIEVRGLSHTYPDGTHALDGIDLTVTPGERVALLGPNGAGKSTLILHLNGVIMPAEGEVFIEGTRLTEKSVAEIRQRVGLVFQDPDDQLFMTTVYDDVAFGPLNMGLSQQEVDSRVHSALHAVGLAELTSKSSQHLSFGQKKRVALATILAMEPGILVLDEPTSNLDPRAKHNMEYLLASQETTMLVATHDMELAWRLCERAVIVDEGVVVVDGPREEILTDRGLLEHHGLDLPPSVAFGEASKRSTGTIEM